MRYPGEWCDYVNQLWHIYHKSNVFSVQVITSRELSSRINETFYVDDNIEAMTSQLNVMSVLTIESSISEQKLLQAVAKSLKSDPFVQKLYSQKEKTILTAHGKYILLNDIVFYVTKDYQYLLYIPEIRHFWILRCFWELWGEPSRRESCWS